VLSVQRIGSTMSAVLGALEPLTAVALGCLFFNEAFTWNVGVGVAMIIPAVLIIIYTRTRKSSEKQSELSSASPNS
jgi:drug/metabolite transporter (DMT)-like permease